MTMFEQLVRGSSEIDRMRNEIRMVSSMLISTLAKVKPGITWYSPREEYSWTVAVGRGPNDSSEEILCLHTPSRNEQQYVFSTCPRRLMDVTRQNLPLEHVQGIHRSMVHMVERLFQKYPELQIHLGPLLKAAQ